MGFIVQIATPQPNVIKLIAFIPLTHWGRVTHICVGNLTIIGSDNGLSPGRRQAIIWTNVGILLTLRSLKNKLQWNFNRNYSIFIQENVFESVVCEMSSISSRPQWVKYVCVCVCSMQCPWCGGRILYHRHSDLLLCRGVLWLLWRVSLSDTTAGDRCVHPRRDGKISDLLSVSSTHRGYSTCGMSNERRRCPLEWHQRPIWMR